MAFKRFPELSVYSKYPRFFLTVMAFTIALLGGEALRSRYAVTLHTVEAAGPYADPAVCANCHPAIAATYRKTGMGRSFRKVRSENDLEPTAPAKPFSHAVSNSFFSMAFQNGAWYQRRWQKGFDDRETNVDEKRVDYVLGSGNHSITLLHLTARNTLQQLPLGWYSEKGGYWAMNPGYDRPDYAGSVRPIYYECMFCHNGYPRIPEGAHRDSSQATYLQPLPEGIDCQRCHGPGQDHVDKASHGVSAQLVRAAIVNPARLSPERGMEVCLQCHLETSNQKLPHAVVRFDRAPFSYRPGEPLSDFEVAFNREPGRNNSFEIAQAGYRFRESQCFLKSTGKLQCTTCHNPHDIPRGEEAVSRYNEVCVGCHRSVTLESTASPIKAAAHGEGANCVRCHMPPRRTDDAIHVVMTDHFIAHRPPEGDLLAERPERAEKPGDSYKGEAVPYYPARLASTAENELTIAVAQVREQSNLAGGLPRLKKAIEQYRPATAGYYAELAQGYKAAGKTKDAIPYFQEAVRRDPSSAFRLIELADALMESREWNKAELQLRRATTLARDDPRAWGRLGWSLWQQDKAPEARAALEKAVSLDPEIPEPHNDLGLILWGTGYQRDAEREFREALRIQPGVAEWRLNLGRALATQGRVSEARYQMDQSVALKPDYTEARIVYARLLSDLNLPREAEAQARAVIAAEPDGPVGHELLGSFLADRGDLDGALPELRITVRLKPDAWRAQFELGAILARQGDSAGAAEHLKIAAQGSDPQASRAAGQALQQLGK